MTEVFSTKQMDAMIVAMKAIITKTITPMKFVLTEQEFQEGFIHPDHMPILQEATKLTGIVPPSGTYYFDSKSVTGEDLSFARYAERSSRVMSPVYVNQGMHHDAPAPLKARFNDWVANRLMLSDAMCDVHGALSYLNTTCTSARAIRTVLPCLPVIMSMMYYNDLTRTKLESSIKAADKIARATGSGGLPLLSREIKLRLQEASSIVASYFALMNEQPVPIAPAYGYTCWLTSRTYSPPVLGRCEEVY